MSQVLLTHPGRFGDALWSLATARAISETIATPVDFMLSRNYGSLKELIQQQPYIDRCLVAEDWWILETAPITPRVPPTIPEGYRFIVHLGYPGWPSAPTLAESIWKIAEAEVSGLLPLELERPWVETHTYTSAWDVVFGFSDEHFETKVGLVEILRHQIPPRVGARSGYLVAAYAYEGRWANEYGLGVKCNWPDLAGLIANAKLFVGCLSSAWVLANAVGQRSVIIEPAEPRHNPLFYLNSPRNTLVRGHDGKPTVDARHALGEIKRVLEGK